MSAGWRLPPRRFAAAFALLVTIGLSGYSARTEATTVTFTSSTTWTAPAGVTSVTAEVWGGGGGGGGQGNTTQDGGGGGGGGAYSIKNVITVVPGNTYAVTVGTGGAGGAGSCGTAGGDSWFVSTATVLAKGGSPGCNSTGTPPAGGAGGAAAAGVGDTKYSGGNGGRGRNNSTGRGGPGGSSAGTAANGTSGPDPWSTLTAAAPPAGGGIGGNGGNSNSNGFAPASGAGGGGGGSGDRSSGAAKVGGDGAAGQVILTFVAATTVTSIVRANPDPAVAPTTLSWTVTFSASVSGVDATAFSLVPSGLSGAAISSVTGSGTTWTVSANTGTGAGTLGLNQTGPGSVSPTLSGTFTGEVYTLVSAFAEYRMDEGFWNGTAGEVQDASGNGNNAQAFNNASTDGATPAIPGNPGTCRYGVFDNGGTITQGYVLTPLPDFTTDFTITAWIRTTNNTVAGQRIFIDDQDNTGGYGFSLGDGGTGILRLYSRAISPVILDSTYAIANNNWYFVAAVADITNRRRTIYVFNALGALLNSTSDAAAFTGTWGTDAGPVSIGAETNASSEPPANFHFHGNLDEVRVYQQALNQAAVTAIATQTHPCSVVGPVPNHYELSMPTNSVACVPTTVTVTACADASSPCTNPFAAASGSTAVLATSGGTLGATPVTFNASGIASTTLSYPTAPDGTPVTVTLSGEQIAASNPRQWCPDGTSCVVANSGATTFKTAGFIFSATAGGGAATIPTQVAGISSATNYLRAVKTNTTTQACEAALSGANAVDFAYECNNPATCYAGNLTSVNGGSATTIARNNNGSVTSYLPVNMTFDANGNAPFTFNYSDVGQVTLWVSKAAGGALLTALAGSSNAFVVKPDHFTIGNIACTTVGAGTCAPANGSGANPAATGPAGGAFIQAGKPFTATVTAMSGAATPAFTPSFGKESPAEGAELTSFNHLPGPGNASAISRVLSGFNSGAATLTDLAWNEVGVLQLHATLSDANGYLGSDPINGKNSVVSSVDPFVGRFIADHLDTVVTAQGGGFAYSGNPTGPVPGQPFTVTVTAMNGLATPTATANYYNAGGYAKNVDLSVPVGGGTGQLYVDAVAGGTGAVPAAKFLNINPGEGKVNYSDATGKISFVFGTLPRAPQTIQIHAEDADTVTSSGANGSINILQGRLRLFNAFGSEKAALSLPLRAEYWSGNSWILNSADSVTQVPAASVALSGYSGTLSATNLGSSHVSGATLSSGLGSIVLAMPSPTATGSVDLAINLGSGPTDQSCLGVYPSTTGAGLAWLRSIYGSCAVTYDRDPSARASFGVYAPETKQTIHVRELY